MDELALWDLNPGCLVSGMSFAAHDTCVRIPALSSMRAIVISLSPNFLICEMGTVMSALQGCSKN